MSITITKNSTAMKIAAIAVTIMFMFTLISVNTAHAALTEAQIQSILSLLSSFGADPAVVDNVEASLRGLPTSGTGVSSAVCPYTWGTNLTQGSTGADVLNLQKFLNDQGSTLASSGAGSPGNETSFYGPITGAAVVNYQEANAADILTPVGLSSGVPHFGPSTRAFANSQCTSAPSDGDTGDTTPPPSVGTGLSVSAGLQPANTLAPADAARVPFTTFTVTAGSDGDVVMNSVVVERTGLAVDANFAGIVLLGADGTQLGLEKTLNSNHQVTVGEAVTIKAGQSMTFTVAGNMANSTTAQSGEVPSLDVVAINTSATVSGSLPIKGAQHTVNTTLAIGSITAQRGPLDPNVAATKEVGTLAYIFSSLKITAGSNEDIRVHSIRWNQASSSAASDLENVVTVVDGVEYPTTISSDSKFYTTVFPGGLLMKKGFSKELSLKADIVSGSGRSVSFTVEEKTDLHISGELFGYGITPPTTGTGISSGNIWFAARTVTVSGGSIVVTQETTITSQDIGENVSNQILGGIKVRVEGENVTVAKITFDVVTSTTARGRVTDATIVDANGAIVAGPVDLPASASNNGVLTFTDTVTFPVGTNIYTIKGKIASEAATDSTYQLRTDPAVDWTTVTGDDTGDSITPSPSGNQTLQTMTIKGAVLAISVSNVPAAQTVVAGAQNFTFANYQLDATASGEDLRLASLPLEYNASGTATDITNCQLFDGSVALNNGTNIVDPSAAASSTVFTFDSAITIPKGTIKTLELKCNISSGTTSGDAYEWGYDSSSSFTPTGVASGQNATLTENDSEGQLITISGNGTFTVVKDSSSPSYAIVAANTTGNTVGVLKFHATNEAITLRKIALQLTASTTPPQVVANASTSASNISQVTIWDGATQVGTALFTGSSFFATSTLTTPVLIPKDGDKLLTVKADFNQIGTSQPGTQGHLVKVDYDGGDSTGTQGTGSASGATIDQGTTADTAMDGVRLFRSFPTLTKLAVPTNTLSNGEKSLLRIKVTADAAGEIGISKFTLLFATTGAELTGVNVYAYTDSGFSNIVSGLSSDGGLLVTDELAALNILWASSATQINFAAETSGGASTTIQVPAGQSRYFEVRGTIASAGSGDSVSAQLEGDAAYVSFADGTFMTGAAAIDSTDTHNDFIWSPNATGTSVVGADDWANGFGVIGLPGSNMSAEVLSL